MLSRANLREKHEHPPTHPCVVLCDVADIMSAIAAMLDKLELIQKAVAEHVSATVSASHISEDQLAHVRSSIGSILVPFSSSGDEIALNELLKLSRTANNFW